MFCLKLFVKYRFTLYLKELHCHLTSLFIHKLYCTNLYQKVIEAMPVSVPAYSCRIGVAVKDIFQSFYSVHGVPGSRFSWQVTCQCPRSCFLHKIIICMMFPNYLCFCDKGSIPKFQSKSMSQLQLYVTLPWRFILNLEIL